MKKLNPYENPKEEAKHLAEIRIQKQETAIETLQTPSKGGGEAWDFQSSSSLPLLPQTVTDSQSDLSHHREVLHSNYVAKPIPSLFSSRNRRSIQSIDMNTDGVKSQSVSQSYLPLIKESQVKSVRVVDTKNLMILESQLKQ
jgi:hypothetical protein